MFSAKWDQLYLRQTVGRCCIDKTAQRRAYIYVLYALCKLSIEEIRTFFTNLLWYADFESRMHAVLRIDYACNAAIG